MHIYLIAIGQKMPQWVQTGFTEYQKRMPPECRLELVELPMAKRSKTSTVQKAKREEWQQIAKTLAKFPRAKRIALDEKGKVWSTRSLSAELQDWLTSGEDVAILVGGPDGFDIEGLASVPTQRSLSALTLPHPLVRVVLAEQLYRAWSLLQNHPYHRS